jgi:hypothetical protein
MAVSAGSVSGKYTNKVTDNGESKAGTAHTRWVCKEKSIDEEG